MGGALVLGGGGLAGIAWTTGVLAGLAEGGADVTGADLVVGTSAGSTVGAQLGGGLGVAELYRRQVEPALQNREIRPVGVDVPKVLEEWTLLAEEIPDPVARRRRIGERAWDVATVPAEERKAVIAGRLPSHDWPEKRLVIVAVAADSGEARCFDRDSGVPLVDAVAASCAVPWVWPVVMIDGAGYVDGGIRTMANADLAAGHDPILILAPLPDPDLDRDVAELSRTARVEVIRPDEAAQEAFGTDPLDPGTRTPAARAGHAQGVRLAPTLAGLGIG